MIAEWKQWCRREPDLVVRGDDVAVRFDSGRGHMVAIEATLQGWKLVARIATKSKLEALEDPELVIWERNRVTQLVGLRIDRHGHLIGEAHVPMAGMDKREFLFYLRTLAGECDRVEALLVGGDEE